MSIRRTSQREVSKSMIAFTLAVLGVFILAAQTWLPRLIGQDSGVQVIRPGLLTVAEPARGIATLRGGASVSLYASGLRISDRDGVLLETVVRGSPLSLITGSLVGTGGRRSEQIDEAASNVRIDDLDTQADRARYTGVIYDGRGSEWPLTMDVTISDDRFTLGVNVPGVQAVVWHLTTDFDIRGYAPTLPERNLKTRAWWLRASVPGGDFTSARGADIRVRPADVPRALDVRERGRIDVHTWSAKSQLVISRRPAARLAPSPIATPTTTPAPSPSPSAVGAPR